MNGGNLLKKLGKGGIGESSDLSNTKSVEV
jgi:hypothetical protein